MNEHYHLATFTEGSAESETFFNEMDRRWPPKEGEDMISVAMKKKIFTTSGKNKKESI